MGRGTAGAAKVSTGSVSTQECAKSGPATMWPWREVPVWAMSVRSCGIHSQTVAGHSAQAGFEDLNACVPWGWTSASSCTTKKPPCCSNRDGIFSNSIQVSLSYFPFDYWPTPTTFLLCAVTGLPHKAEGLLQGALVCPCTERNFSPNPYCYANAISFGAGEVIRRPLQDPAYDRADLKAQRSPSPSFPSVKNYNHHFPAC